MKTKPSSHERRGASPESHQLDHWLGAGPAPKGFDRMLSVVCYHSLVC
jgi:hypothetical protein